MAQQSNDKKQASKNQSRPVAGSPKRTAPTKAQRRSTSTLLTWGAVALVIVIVAVLVIVKLTGSSTPSGGGNAYEPAPATIVKQVTQIPASVYDTVGVTAPVTQITPPTQTTGQAPLTFKDSTGASKPGVLYLGAEYCPYCAAERWAVIASLSRFGTFTGLGLTASSTSDVYPGTPSFTFYKSTMSSDHLVFKGIEQYTNIPTASGGYTALVNPTAAELALVEKFDTAKFIPNGQTGAIPFMTIGNQFLVSGASYSPSILNGLTREQIASGLSDPTNPVTQAIVATSNYISASICKITGGQPANVCTSKGVQAAAKAMKISF